MAKMHLITLPIEQIEEAFGIKLKKNSTSLGLDTATCSGWAIIKTDKKDVIFNIGYIEVNVSNIKDKYKREEVRYSKIFDMLRGLIDKKYITVIENVYYGGNAKTLIILARIGAIAYSLARIAECSTIFWRTAGQARKALGLPYNKKKKVIIEMVNKKLGLKLSSDDEIDAIVLALNGLLI